MFYQKNTTIFLNSNKLFSSSCFVLLSCFWLLLLVSRVHNQEQTEPTSSSSSSASSSSSSLTPTETESPVFSTTTPNSASTSKPYPQLGKCDTFKNCTLNQICVNGHCSCLPNYSLVRGKCRLRNCHANRDLCQQQDPNRFCEIVPLINYGRCVCQSNFIEDPLTKVCRPKCSMMVVPFIFPRPSVTSLLNETDVKSSNGSTKPTTKPSSATICELVDSANSLCNIYRCQCRTNFRRNWITAKCEPFRCETSSQCWTDGDKYRVCNNGTCVCNYDIDPLTERCTIQLSSLFKIRYYYSWHSEKILLCTIIIVPIVFYYCFVQNFRKAKSTLISLKSPESNYTTDAAASGPNQPKPFQNNLVQTKIFKTNYESDNMTTGNGAPSTTGYKSLPLSLNQLDPKQKKADKQFKYTRFS